MSQQQILKELPVKQQEILDYIKVHVAGIGYPPTIREIAGYMGVKSHFGIRKQLERLELKGYITRERGLSRTIVLTNLA